MKLWVLPDDGLSPLLKGMDGAKSSIEVMIFRFDRTDIEAALARAVGRGVAVRALVAHANKAGEDGLRRLELRLLAAGVSVARTADDLLRYHGKLVILDRRELYLLGFNFVSVDIERSRTFGMVTTNRSLVQEALHLFEADSKRLPYAPRSRTLIVSPVNARQRLAAFLRGAKRQLLIYDPAVNDPAMLRILEERAKAGVSVRIIGHAGRASSNIEVHRQPRLRLHTRTIVRDGTQAFLGSQSLRAAELDKRREIGAIFSDRQAVARITSVFEQDWKRAGTPSKRDLENQKAAVEKAPAEKVAKKLAKAVVKEMPPLAPVVKHIIEEMGVEKTDVVPSEVEANVKDAVKTAVKEIVRDAVEGAAGDTPRKKSDAA